jgi:hypothetical protein
MSLISDKTNASESAEVHKQAHGTNRHQTAEVIQHMGKIKVRTTAGLSL